MRLNFLFSNARETDGYGRYVNRLIAALRKLGVDVRPQHTEIANAPAAMQAELGLEWDALTISCLPPFYLNRVPGPHWLISMTEGSRLPVEPVNWADIINRSNVERVIVPCQHNADVFYAGGVLAPIDVVPGGTDPDEFRPIISRPDRPYTFLAIADRGVRKGWVETWQAFYKAFGGPDDTPDVRLVIKSRPDGNDLLELIARADKPDPRVTILMQDMDMREFYAMGDCMVIPSRSEGFGMPHREAARCGLPVITQAYSGMDDGHTNKWAIVVKGGKLDDIPAHFEHIAGQWLKADVGEVAAAMRAVYDEPASYQARGRRASEWLGDYQTWRHSALLLLDLIGEYHGAFK